MNKKIITLHWNEDERISNSIIESFYNIKNFKDNIEKNQIYKKLLLTSDEVLKKKINEKVDNKKYIVDCNFSKLMENTKIDKILFYLDDKASLSLSKDKKIAIQFENINLNDLTVLFSKEGIESQKNINYVSVDSNNKNIISNIFFEKNIKLNKNMISEIEIINKDEEYDKYLENFTRRLKEKYNKKVNIPKKEKNADRGIER
ncbi:MULTISPECIES: hypothetical protein [unclassified Fusobacterium]|jgi:hypothetical protein|uniref:Uncharacterized protein n=1 Tax=Fusobacterium nucleatum TaxID=851 RepID=A0A323UBG3_FUSNU|nr:MULTISPECIES: hypothetical protein [Fusobacterium]EUB33731.1 hypothetical protein HMPREF1501_0694 [Fusobacterium sp. OBRC1]PCR85136.1 hypothetical protein CQA79_05990 [Fusobacterium nucleatum]PZA05118.1 hypothetical protein DNF10_02265 [Fusobacterium nucleatum]QJX51670.1 hypothetical protein HOO60_12300 [Fusobacterium nucleatum]HCE32587.1 hypothetical protein [Fusobacterium sp.]